MLVWTDLETTGLVATKERVLEVAVIITDDQLNEVARFERVTSEARRTDFTKVDPFVLAMHSKNGLWTESLQMRDGYARVLSPSSNVDHIDEELAAFVKQYCATSEVVLADWKPSTGGNKVGPQLAGSTISFDRSFLAAHLPQFHATLHYRNVDVSSFNEIAKRFWPAVYDARPCKGKESAHRAMPDVVESLNVMRHYISCTTMELDAVRPAIAEAPVPMNLVEAQRMWASLGESGLEVQTHVDALARMTISSSLVGETCAISADATIIEIKGPGEIHKPVVSADIATKDGAYEVKVPDAPAISTQPEFKEWSKISRFRQLTCRITEKLDGTNCSIYVPENGGPLLAGSRTRWITPGKNTDNFGFAQFVADNEAALRQLGPGRHYGEWFGAGIQRRYGLTEKRLALFHIGRYATTVLAELAPRISVVPVLYDGPVDTAAIENTIADLYANGSKAVPGWSKPEGAVIEVGGQRWKVTDAGDVSKWTLEKMQARAALRQLDDLPHSES